MTKKASQPTKAKSAASTKTSAKKALSSHSNAIKALKSKEHGIVMTMGKLHSIGKDTPKKKMVEMYSDNAKTPESYKKNLGILRKAGFVEYHGDCVGLTSRGLAYVGQHGEPQSEDLTNEHCHDVMKSLLSKKGAEIFGHLANGQSRSKRQLAVDMGYDMSKLSGYNKDLSKMSSMGFLIKNDDSIRLSDECFPFGRPDDESD